jgi:TPR repeat protein/DNA-binding XRE family transcriptional regulator
MTQQPYADPLGSLVRRIRERELLLSQSDLAWLAGVSRGTISNVETGRVTPDTRTWHRIRTALALPSIPLEGARTGVTVQLVLPADAVQGIVDAIVTIRDRDPDGGRRAADRWRRLIVRLTREDDPAWPVASAELSWLADDVAPLIPPGKLTVLYDALRTWGWAPGLGRAGAEIVPRPDGGGLQPVEELAHGVKDLAEQFRVYQNRIQGFDRLPEPVRDALTQGLVVGGDITTPESSPEVSIVSLTVMNETESSFDAQREAYSAALRWSAVLAVAAHIVEKQAPHLSPEEIKQALKVGLDAQSPAVVHELLPVARRGDPRAMYELAQLFRKNGRPDEAEYWFHRAAEAGHPGALFNLGKLAYEEGRHREAEHWLSGAADANHPTAPYLLAKLLHRENPQQAEKWLRKAADVGNRDAMYELWSLYQDSEPKQAEQWLRRAANYGHRQALSDLTQLVAKRAGSEKELIRWLHRAAEEGDTGAMRRLEVMLYEMQLSQRAAARRAAG